MTLAELSVALPLAAACVVISGFCSGTEVALFSLRRVDREQLTHSNLGADQRILSLLERPRRLIATVLLGNVAFDALLAITALAVVSAHIGFASPWANGGVALAIALPLIVLFSEVTSKTAAAKSPLAWARATAAPLQLFALIVTPVRLVLQTVAQLLLRPLGDAARARPSRDLSADDFRAMVDAGSAQGQVDARERRLIHRVFEFNDKNVGQVMTPRERIFALSYDLPVQRLVKECASRGFSRVPIYQKTLDNVRGVLNAKDLMRSAAGQPLNRPFNELLHEPLFVPRTTPVKRLFLTFKQKKVHMAVVVSEYGKVLGLVTMDDLLSQIFGVLRDERAELQDSMSMPATARPRVRTPAPGTPTELTSARPGSDSGPIARPPSDPGDSGGMVDPPAPPGLRPIHVPDELTPPAADIGELERDLELSRRDREDDRS